MELRASYATHRHGKNCVRSGDCAQHQFGSPGRRSARIEDEVERLKAEGGFPDWDYVPSDEGHPFEHKPSDWGRLPDGRLVALDYSAPALD
jgi:hypothetical protein